MRVAIEMHSSFKKQGASKESKYILGSLWTLPLPKKDCAFSQLLVPPLGCCESGVEMGWE